MNTTDKAATLSKLESIRRDFSEVFCNADVSKIFIVARKSRTEFRLGEWAGDWIMSGTVNDVLARMERDGVVYQK